MNGRDIAGSDAHKKSIMRRRTIGFVFQFYNLIHTCTIPDSHRESESGASRYLLQGAEQPLQFGKCFSYGLPFFDVSHLFLRFPCYYYSIPQPLVANKLKVKNDQLFTDEFNKKRMRLQIFMF